MLQASRSVAYSLQWETTVRFLQRLAQRLSIHDKISRKHVFPVILCVVLVVSKSWKSTCITAYASSPALTGNIRATPLTPTFPSVSAGRNPTVDSTPSASAAPVDAAYPSTTITTSKIPRRMAASSLSKEAFSLDSAQIQGVGVKPPARVADQARPSLGRGDIPSNGLFSATIVKSRKRDFVLNAVPSFAQGNGDDTGISSVAAENAMRESLKQVRKKKEHTRQRLEKLSRDVGQLNREDIGTSESERERRRLHQILSDLQAEETELQKQLADLVAMKTDRDFQHQTEDRAQRQFQSRFEQQASQVQIHVHNDEQIARERYGNHRNNLATRYVEHAPAYMQVTYDISNTTSPGGDQLVTTEVSVGNGKIIENAPGHEEDVVSRESDGRSSPDKDSQTSETVALEKRLGHAIPVLPKSSWHTSSGYASGTFDTSQKGSYLQQRPTVPGRMRGGFVLLELEKKKPGTGGMVGSKASRSRTSTVAGKTGNKTDSGSKPRGNVPPQRKSNRKDEGTSTTRTRQMPSELSIPKASPRLRKSAANRFKLSGQKAGIREKSVPQKVSQRPIKPHISRPLKHRSRPRGTPLKSDQTHTEQRRKKSVLASRPNKRTAATDGRKEGTLDRRMARPTRETRRRRLRTRGKKSATRRSVAAARDARTTPKRKTEPHPGQSGSALKKAAGAKTPSGVPSAVKRIAATALDAAATSGLHFVAKQIAQRLKASPDPESAAEEIDDLNSWDEESTNNDERNARPAVVSQRTENDGYPTKSGNNIIENDFWASEEGDGDKDANGKSELNEAPAASVKGNNGDEDGVGEENNDTSPHAGWDAEEEEGESNREKTEPEESAKESEADEEMDEADEETVDEADEELDGLSAVEVSDRRPRFHLHAASTSHTTHSQNGQNAPDWEDEGGEGAPWEDPGTLDGDESDEEEQYGSAWEDVEQATSASEYTDGHGESHHTSGYGESAAAFSNFAGDSRGPSSPAYIPPKVHKRRTFDNSGLPIGKNKMGTSDRISTSSTSTNTDDVTWEPREKLHVYTEDDVYRQAHDTIPGLDYLGTGYDMMKGNPIGDPQTAVDPGFRGPILRFQWKHSPYGVTNDLSLLQPVGGFVRPFVSCRRSESADEISTLTDYQNELSVDAKAELGIPFVSFSAGTSYKEMAKEIAQNENKTFLLKIYCFRYEAGLASAPQIHWNTTYGFERALMNLSTTFDGLEPGNGCPPSVYKTAPTSDACKETGVSGWMQLFDQYGTHVTSNIKLGGKIVHSLKMKKTYLETMKDKGVAVSAAVSTRILFASGGVSTSTSTSNSSRDVNATDTYEVTTYVIGGRPPKDPTDPASLVLWSRTVQDLPMPIQSKLQPLSFYMPPEFQKAYDLALAYYGRTCGMSQADLDRIFNVNGTSLTDRLRDSHSIVWGGAAPGSVECPGEEVVMLGFAITYNFSDVEARSENYHISICEAGKRRCEGAASQGLPGDEARIWIICSRTELVALWQIVIESDNQQEDEDLEAHCPAGMEIMVGLKLDVAYGPDGALQTSIDHCVTGSAACRMPHRPLRGGAETRRFVYVSCLEDTYPGFQSVQAMSNVGDVGNANGDKVNADGAVVMNCGPDRLVLVGKLRQG